jgi:hypothetical protein
MEKQRLRVFKNIVLRRIFGPKRNEVTGGWGKLHNEEHYTWTVFKYNYNDQVKGGRKERARSMHGEEDECMEDFCGKARRRENIRTT